MDAHVPRALAGDGQLLSPPQNSGRRVRHGVTADVHRVPLPRVKYCVVGLKLGCICEEVD